MDDTLKLTISLTFDDEGNSWLTNLAKMATKDQGIIYRAGEESIPHLTLVKAEFRVKKRNGKSHKDLSRSIEEAIRAERLFSEVPDLLIGSKSTWTSTSESGVFTGLHVLNDTMLQRLNNKCVKIVEKLGGEVTSAHGISFFPHVTLALLQSNQTPQDIFGAIKKDKVLHAPNLVVGKNGIGGRLIKVFSEMPNALGAKKNVEAKY